MMSCKSVLSATILAVTVLLSAFSTGALGGESKSPSNRMYKWVDEKGVTHYGEFIPPEYQNQESVEMNARGVVVRKQDRAPTPDEIRQKEREAERKRQEFKQAEEQARRDKALLATYTTESQLEETRGRHLLAPGSVMKTLEPQIKKSLDRMSELKKKASEFVDKQKPVPESLQEEIEDEEAQVQSLQMDMARKKSETDSINARFDADKKRLRELRGLN